MTRLSTPTQSLINSLMRLNCPRRFLPQAQCTSKHTIRALRNSLQDKKLKEKRGLQILQTARTTADSDTLSKRVHRRSQSSSPAPQDAGPSAKHNHPSRAGIRRSNEQPLSKQKSQWRDRGIPSK
ncbi:hypothetical protein CRG98_045244 [Punica granatum]|uniref:Uncharacterized protein n=1 Tax=Punica granatum TaxID=22663 RepID=A0A2I0HRM1_PUNGR|nr:hypothetical protein CRG98_045244 [Punica granatum]